MRSIVVDPASPNGYSFADVPEPDPGPRRAVVAVSHVSLNHGDLNDARSGRLPPGEVLGSDAAGEIVEAASDGSGPSVGTRVVGLVPSAFAEYASADVAVLAPVPDGVDLASAAGLPVAGLAAIQSLERAGTAPGSRVLVTGASGGVGRYAVQIASRLGAQVTAAIGTSAAIDELTVLGAAAVVVGAEGLDELGDKFDVIIDNIGGPMLVRGFQMLAPGGDLQSVGWASAQPAVFGPYSTVGPPRSLTSFLIGGDLGVDLTRLIRLCAAGELAVVIGWRGSWDRIAEAAALMESRALRGKAILDVGKSSSRVN